MQKNRSSRGINLPANKTPARGPISLNVDTTTNNGGEGEGGEGELYFGGRKCASKCIEGLNAQNVQIVKFESTIKLVDCSFATFSLER